MAGKSTISLWRAQTRNPLQALKSTASATVLLILCLTLSIGAPVMAAQEPSFRLDADSLYFQKNTGGSLVISIINARGARITRIDGLDEFEIISQSQSTSTSIIQGVTTYQEDTYYLIMPLSAGEFELKAYVEYDGMTYETNALFVTVGESGAEGDEPVRDLFVVTAVSHDEAYIGEKIVVTYELYTRYNIEGFALTDYAAIDGAVTRETPDDQLKAEYAYLDGERYAKYQIKQLILDPVKTGAFTIPSFRLQANVVTDGGRGTGRMPSPFGGSGSSPFGGSGGSPFGNPGSIFGNPGSIAGPGSLFTFSEPVYIQTDSKELVIKPLPANGRPAGFSGIVGQLKLDGRFSREELTFGDSLNFQVTASGNCNLDGMKSIFAGETQGFAVYETQKNALESVEENQYYVEKTFEAILVPDRTGDLDVAPLSISYFNPASGKYETASIPGAVIRVGGNMPQGGAAGGIAAPAEAMVINQINYSDAGAGYLSFRIDRQVLFILLVTLAAALVLAAAILFARAVRKKRNPVVISLYRRLTASNEVNEIYSLFNDMVKHWYNLSVKASSRRAVLSGVPDAVLAGHISEIMDYMESNTEKKPALLKDKIKRVYRMNKQTENKIVKTRIESTVLAVIFCLISFSFTPITAGAATWGYDMDQAYSFTMLDAGKDSVLSRVAIIRGNVYQKDTPVNAVEGAAVRGRDRANGAMNNGIRQFVLLQTPVVSTRRLDISPVPFRPVTQRDAEGNIHYFHDNEEKVCIEVFDQYLSPLRSLTITKQLPNFGTAAIDRNGNYYLAFGKNITDEDNKSEKNVAVAKYDATGKLLGSTWFVGGEGYLYGTKNPFYSTPRMAISQNILATHFSRIMFAAGDGLNHQSSTVLYVDIDTMSPINIPTPYVSHSFEQAAMATGDGGFVFVDRGDRYPRGFHFCKVIWKEDFSFTPFHFREHNPYQTTNSLLGGVAESERGYILVGTSERVLSTVPISAGQGDPQDLFFQMIRLDFYGYENNDRIISDGVTRRSEAAADDSEYGQVYEDVGVVWLTAYPEGHNAVSPKVASQEDGFVIMWEQWIKHENGWQSYADTWYMLLHADGSVQKPPAVINGNPRLSAVDEISYYNGKVFWTSNDYEHADLYSMTIYDMPSPWALAYVDAAVSAGLVPQPLQSGFSQTINRAEFCTLATAFYEKITGSKIRERISFDDTNDVNVEKMAAVGVVAGVGDNRFAPDDPLTREQAAVMLSNLAAATGNPLDKQAATFDDNADISPWAIDPAGEVQAAGIMGGVGNNTFAPKSPYTREQSIVTMTRLWENMH